MFQKQAPDSIALASAKNVAASSRMDGYLNIPYSPIPAADQVPMIAGPRKAATIQR
jgi:hypothetical protein